MERTDSTAAMASLANQYAEDESDYDDRGSIYDDIPVSDEESMIRIHPQQNLHSSQNSPASRSDASNDSHSQNAPRKLRATKLVSYGADDVEERSSGHSDDEDDIDSSKYDVTLVDGDLQNTSLSQTVRYTPLEDITLPPEPPGRCAKYLQEKIARQYEKVKEGFNMTEFILSKKLYRNPSIYGSLVKMCDIDEFGSNYPPDIYDPHGWSKDSFYDALAEAQKKEMDKREKERKERTKIEFISGVKKATPVQVADHTGSKKIKLETTSVSQVSRPSVVTTTSRNPPVISMTTSATGTKTTLISAIGNIYKK